MSEIETRCTVEAPAQAVWSVLTDFARYPDWNPMMERMIGEPEVGAPLTLHVRIRGRRLVLPAEVRICDPLEHLSWGGGLSVLLGVDHYVRLQASGDRTHVVHGERFTGLLGFGGARVVGTAPYEAMNAALIERVAALG